MQTVAFHTLGCKVNQYDTQAMLEAFQQAGYQVVSFHQKADVYVVNTCTVTGTGDKKSLQILRRVRRQHPESQVIVAGCLAQRQGEALLSTRVRLVIGTQRRGEVVSILEKAVAEDKQICAVSPLTQEYEPLTIQSQEEHTRAVLKIQEGCDRHCTYCIIPSVRGPIRSRPLPQVKAECERLGKAGFQEVVFTGIHISSYGKDLKENITLADAIRAAEDTSSIKRIRLGSLEPTIIDEAFVTALTQMDKLCPQFHLALQSGSNGVLGRMARRYNMDMYYRAVDLLKAAFPHAALTTDILTGFPGETEDEFAQTKEAIRRIGFAKIHVFPYSPREGTPAATMPGQLPQGVKDKRTRELIALGDEVAKGYRLKLAGTLQSVLFEEPLESGIWEGYTPQYIRVEAKSDQDVSGKILPVRLTSLLADGMSGEIEI